MEPIILSLETSSIEVTGSSSAIDAEIDCGVVENNEGITASFVGRIQDSNFTGTVKLSISGSADMPADRSKVIFKATATIKAITSCVFNDGHLRAQILHATTGYHTNETGEASDRVMPVTLSVGEKVTVDILCDFTVSE